MQNKSLAEIRKSIEAKKTALDQLDAARNAVRAYNDVPLAQRGASADNLKKMLSKTPAKKIFALLAQGDSWFDYPIGTDIIDCLHSHHGHTIKNLAVAGSTLNDEAYGPVPSEMFGFPFGAPQSDDPDRITELVYQIQKLNPQALLLSAGGNDIAGEEFFSFVNNARSGLPPVNEEVLSGVVNGTFKAAYLYIIDIALQASPGMKIFTHGYDYPWPDGRPAVSFLGWKVGPWFDSTFKAKNYPNADANDLYTRHNIVMKFIDALNNMLAAIAADPKYAGKVFHVDLRATLTSPSDWANELHPGNDGFKALADKIDAALQTNM